MNKHHVMVLIASAQGALLLPAPLIAAPATLVFCAPGYPGTTEEAQPTMSAFASAVVEHAGGEAEGLRAVYHPTVAGGVEQLRQEEAGAAMVTLPFFLQHRSDLGLQPLMQGLRATGAEEVWTLVAARGRVHSPEDLHGWEIVSTAGFAPAFVRGPALAAWGQLPADVRINATSRVLSALRRAAADESVAVLLDGAQSEALPRLPFADELETVARSSPLPNNLLCTVKDRMGSDQVEALVTALAAMAESDSGRAALEAIRLVGFQPLAEGALEGIVAPYEDAARDTP